MKSAILLLTVLQTRWSDSIAPAIYWILIQSTIDANDMLKGKSIFVIIDRKR